MAHELGHLLLQSMEHSRTGIMRSRWGKEELLRAESGRLLFTTEQAAAMTDETDEVKERREKKDCRS